MFVDLLSFKALITEAEEHDLPLCPLLEALTLTVTEACKCSAVVHKLFTNKVSTRWIAAACCYLFASSHIIGFVCGRCRPGCPGVNPTVWVISDIRNGSQLQVLLVLLKTLLMDTFEPSNGVVKEIDWHVLFYIFVIYCWRKLLFVILRYLIAVAWVSLL